MKCENYIESKMSNEPFENNRTRATETLELIHTDLNGPHDTIGYCGEKYFVTFIDDYSKCAKIFALKVNQKLLVASLIILTQLKISLIKESKNYYAIMEKNI